MIGQRDTDFSHPDVQLPRMRRDEADVQSLVQLMETNWLNPFSPEHGELVSLSTAAKAPSEVAKDLLEVYKVGEEAYQTFMQERLQEDVPSMQFHEVTKTKLKTFSDIRKKSCSLKLTGDCLARWSSLQKAESCRCEMSWPIHWGLCLGHLPMVMGHYLSLIHI